MKYVILGQAGGIGGWQLYVEARMSYLRDRGYDVKVISISGSKWVVLSSFRALCPLCLPEVHMSPSSYTKGQKESILKVVYEYIGNDSDDELIVESTDINLSMWGEIIASHYHGRNFSYLLHSHIPEHSAYVNDFFFFKYQRNELAGMSDLTLPDLFAGSSYAQLVKPKSLPAAPRDPITSENTIPSITEYILRCKRDDNSFVIGYFGNLDKPHFCALCKFIEEYVKDKARNFIFISVGSSGKGNAERLQKDIEGKAANCRVVNVPAMYPVPNQIFKVMDVCIASWGSAENAARAGAMTIRLQDDVSINPQGILGIHIKDYKGPNCKESLSELIDNVVNKVYGLDDYKFTTKPYDFIGAHQMIDAAIFGAACDKCYYNIDDIAYSSKRSRVEKVMNSLFGIKMTMSIIGAVKKMGLRPM